MKNLFNFFFSFDKLMKEGLVRAFFWLGLIYLILWFFADSFAAIKLSWFAAVFEFVQFFAKFLLALVVLRLLSELAIAIFRINDNVSPDGGKSETANIDPVAEARRAAEQAAKRASELSKTAVDRTSAATKSASEKTRDTFSDVSGKVSDAVPSKKTLASKAATTKANATKTANDMKDRTIAPKKTATKKKAPAKKQTSKPVTKKTAPKTTSAKKVTLNKDGTQRKKRAPNKSKK